MLPSILDGLADEAEGVRDAALAAGRTFVDLYAETALPLLLPAVEDGILNDNWRIRQSSVELLGQLLFKASPYLLHESNTTVHALYKTGTRLLLKAGPCFCMLSITLMQHCMYLYKTGTKLPITARVYQFSCRGLNCGEQASVQPFALLQLHVLLHIRSACCSSVAAFQ